MAKKTVVLSTGKERTVEDQCAVCKKALSDDPNSPLARHIVADRLVCRRDVPEAIQRWEPQP
jgi:hypothetical protein